MGLWQAPADFCGSPKIPAARCTHSAEVEQGNAAPACFSPRAVAGVLSMGHVFIVLCFGDFAVSRGP